jgi:hypothetical protein
VTNGTPKLTCRPPPSVPEAVLYEKFDDKISLETLTL